MRHTSGRADHLVSIVPSLGFCGRTMLDGHKDAWGSSTGALFWFLHKISERRIEANDCSIWFYSKFLEEHFKERGDANVAVVVVIPSTIEN